MTDTLRGIVSVDNEVQPPNATSPIEVRPSGKVTDCNPSQYAKAKSPIVATDTGNSMFFNNFILAQRAVGMSRTSLPKTISSTLHERVT